MGQYIWKCCNRIYYLFLHQRRRRTSVIYWISEKPSQRLRHQFSLAQKLELRSMFQYEYRWFLRMLPNIPLRRNSSAAVIAEVGWLLAAKNGSTFGDNFFQPTTRCPHAGRHQIWINYLMWKSLAGLEWELLNPFQNIYHFLIWQTKVANWSEI